MNQAIGYVRISTEEQSNWSIEGQMAEIQEYCKRYHLDLIHIFVDEGFSAKDFNRPGWQELVGALRRSKGSIGTLVVMKYDRLIRNAMEGLYQLKELESKYKVTVVSIRENMGMDPTSPFFKKIRADILVNAEFERDTIIERVTFGMHQALSAGRYLNRAPFGYQDARDPRGLKIIVPDADRAGAVLQAYKDAASGVPHELIRRDLQRTGYSAKAKMAIRRLLTNPVYAGFVNVPSYKGKPSQLVEGIHEAIVPRELWYRVQSLLKQSESTGPKIYDEHLPLRGFVRCTEGHLATGTMVVGKTKRRFPHYKCKQCNQNMPGKVLHEQISQVLHDLSLAPEQAERLLAIVQDKWQNRVVANRKLKETMAIEIQKLENLLAAAEDKYIRTEITKEAFDRATGRYATELAKKRIELAGIKEMPSDVTELLKRNASKLTDLQHIWNVSQVQLKQRMLHLIFPGGLTWNSLSYQTPFLNPLLSLKPLSNAPLRIKENPSEEGSKEVVDSLLLTVKPFLQLLDQIPMSKSA
jgi:site-specific DNA recombinase